METNSLRDLLEKYSETVESIWDKELSLAISTHQKIVKFIVDGDFTEFEDEIKRVLKLTKNNDSVSVYRNPILLDILKLMNIHLWTTLSKLSRSDNTNATKLAKKIVFNQFVTLEELIDIENMLLDDTKAKEIFREEIERINTNKRDDE